MMKLTLASGEKDFTEVFRPSAADVVAVWRKLWDPKVKEQILTMLLEEETWQVEMLKLMGDL